MEKLKKILLVIGAATILGCFAFSMLTSDLKHIEDNNGADNYQLQQITDGNIINMDIGALNFSETKSILSDMPEYSSNKFTGVAEIYKNNIVGNRFDITLYNTQVNSGNFKIVLIHNDEIVHEFKLNELMQSYTLKNPNGSVCLRIAGESADFSFSYALV